MLLELYQSAIFSAANFVSLQIINKTFGRVISFHNLQGERASVTDLVLTSLNAMHPKGEPRIAISGHVELPETFYRQGVRIQGV